MRRLVSFNLHLAWLCAGAVLVFSIPLTAHAIPIQFDSNFYDFVSIPEGINWADAKNAAASSTFNGSIGHLATITSQAENDFLSSSFTMFPTVVGSWLGGQVSISETGIWVVGPEAGQAFSQGQSSLPGHYSNWPPAGIEPNNASGFPDAVYMLVGTTYSDSNGYVEHGQWADAAGGISSSSDPVLGYFVEFESPTVSPVPEPETYALLLAGLGLLAGIRKWSTAPRFGVSLERADTCNNRFPQYVGPGAEPAHGELWIVLQDDNELIQARNRRIRKAQGDVLHLTTTALHVATRLRTV